MEFEAVAPLVPGFRFYPTDEEIVGYYLKRKVCGIPFPYDAIAEIDIYKSEPWDLPDQSKLKNRDLEWYFFSSLDRKYGNGSRANRTTVQGFWKTTGKDRPVRRNSRTVGMKRILVFHIGRAPRGERTNWVMHEYRLVDEELREAGVVQDAFVLCRIFQKSGSGPRNGEENRAHFVEEDWDDTVLVPQEETAEDVFFDFDAYIQENDLEQNVEAVIPSENVPLPLCFCCGDGCNCLKDSIDFLEDDQKLLIAMGENDDLLELPDDQQFFDFSEQYQMDPAPVTDEMFVELNDLVNHEDATDPAVGLVDELGCIGAPHDAPVHDGSFLEINDFSNPIEADPSGFDMLEEYLIYFNAINDNSQYVALDSSRMFESEDLVLDQSQVNGEIGQAFSASEQPLETHGGEGSSSSKQNPEAMKFEPDVQNGEGRDNALVKWASRMLSCISVPPAFASEFPSTEAAIGQNSSAPSSNSIHVSSGMIQISSKIVRGSEKEHSPGKNEDVNVMLSYGMSRDDLIAADNLLGNSVGLEPMASIVSGNAGSAMVRSGFLLVLFSVLILLVSFKIGTCIYSR